MITGVRKMFADLPKDHIARINRTMYVGWDTYKKIMAEMPTLPQSILWIEVWTKK